LAPVTSSRPDDWTCRIARWTTRWKPLVEFGVEVMRDGGLELAGIDPARAHHLGGMFVIDQREQQVLERRIFVATRGRGLERLVQRCF
jgi:hypothetical protein